MNITNNKDGKYLYKYLPFNQNSLKILIDNKFYLSPPDLQNDPFEGDFKISNLPDLYKEKTFEILLENRKKEGITWLDNNTKERLLKGWLDMQEFQLYLEDYLSNTIKRRYGTTSFSKNCRSILMWSHYADSHKGFVIVFDRESLSLQYGILGNIFNVEYNGAPEISVDANDLSINDNNKPLFKNKLRSWAKEKEVRIIKEHFLKKEYESPYSRLLKFPPESIVGIIYGSKMSLENVMTIENLLDLKSLSHIETYGAYKNKNKDELLFKKRTIRISKLLDFN